MLVPKEHGTYGELLFPLVAAIVLGSPNAGVWSLAAIALGGFLGHEGARVLVGGRGPRAQRDQRTAAWRSLGVCGGLALAGAVVATPVLTSDAWTAATIAAALSLLAIVSAAVGAEHSLAGETLAAVALPAWALPVAVQGGVSWIAAMVLAGTWICGYVGATGVVHVVIARTRKRPVTLPAIVAVTGALAGPAVSSAALPLSAAVAVLLVLPVTAHRLRHVGWGVVAASAGTLVWRLLCGR